MSHFKLETAQLAHAERNQVTAAYVHTEYLPERREMMQRWADYLGEQNRQAQSVEAR